MALLSAGPIGTASGRIGGATCAISKTGLTIRASKPTTAGRSAKQENAKLDMAYLSAFWHSSAMDDLRPAWETYAANTLIPNRLGTPRLLSGFNTWLRFGPLHRMFCPSGYYLQPPRAHNTSYMTTLSAYFDTTPSLVITAPGVWLASLTYEQFQFARFQPATGKIIRPIWQNPEGWIGIKLADSEEKWDTMAYDTEAILGETWAIRCRWWPVVWDSGPDTYQIDCEPTPWIYCKTTCVSP